MSASTGQHSVSSEPDMEMRDGSQEMSCLASRQEDKGCDVKLASNATAAQRIDHRFVFQVQAISAEKRPFILDAVVDFTTIAPITADDDDSLSCHIFNDHVRGVIEDKTRLAASMTMEEIFRRATTSSSINHQAAVAFLEPKNVQLELKQFGRLIVCDACVYVKPQFVEHKPAWVVQVDSGDIDDAMKQVPRKVESSKRPSKIDGLILKESFFLVIFGNDTTAARKKSWPNYTLKALLFALTMLFSTYMSLSSSTSITIKILLVVDIVVFITINAVLLIKLPDWGNALAFISWFLLELIMCLVILPFNGCYALAILAVLFLIVVVALLQLKFRHSVKKYVLPSFTDGDQENDYLNHLFDISNAIATCGGLVTGVLGYYSYMVGPVTAAGFFFFSTVLLGLYLMMVIAMRAVSPPHAACLVLVLSALLLLTVITASVSFVRHSSVTM